MQGRRSEYAASRPAIKIAQSLCETIGLSLASPVVQNRRQFAVVPRTKATENLAKRMAECAARAGVTIAIVDGARNVETVEAGR